MKLLLADDHTLFRDALVQFLERIAPDARVAVAKDMQGVFEIMAHDAAFDLVLLDFRMPGMDGLKGLEKLRKDYPDVPVALLSGLAEKTHVEKAMELGAAGFFPKTMSGRALLGGIQKILDGGHFIPIDHKTRQIMPSYYDDGSGGYTGSTSYDEAMHEVGETRLTPREKEVLSHLLNGASNREIAIALELQVVTIKLHVRGICRKLGARNRTQAALKAQHMGLLS